MRGRTPKSYNWALNHSGEVHAGDFGTILGVSGAAASGAQSVGFGATVNYLTPTTAGLTDTKELSFSAWFYYPASWGLYRIIYSGTGKVLVYVDASGFQRYRLYNSAGTNILHLRTNALTGPGWFHVAASVNTATPVAHLYINGVSNKVELISPVLDSLVDISDGQWNIGDVGFTDNATQIWMDDGYVDFSDPATLAKFYNSGYVDFGADGSGPTGSKPMLFYDIRDDESLDDFKTGKGILGDLTLSTGTPTLETGPA